MEKIKLNIDNTIVEVEKGTTILQAAKLILRSQPCATCTSAI
jgi:hypothetical protein